MKIIFASKGDSDILEGSSIATIELGYGFLFSAPTLRMNMSAPTGQRWVEEQIWKSRVMGLDWDYSKVVSNR
jgi:hypothetical protein